MPAPSCNDLLAGERDHLACRSAIRTGSRSSFAASWLLPTHVRRPAFGLYAFCRLADDAIDLEGGAAALASVRQRLNAAYAGRPHDHAADRVFADLVRQHQIPRELPEALIEGFQWDCEGRRYATLEELHDYGARVASAVGAMMTLLMGVRESVALARACDLGIAMQLTNIARDVGEDARAGRLYLPLDWMAEAGLDPDAFLKAPTMSPPLARVIARLLDEADRLYVGAREGVARLPPRCRPAILAAAEIYAAIGDVLARRGHDSVSARVSVGASRKLTLIAGAGLRAVTLRPKAPEPALSAAAFLVDAAARPNALRPAHAHASLQVRVSRVLEIFERLERADQMGR